MSDSSQFHREEFVGRSSGPHVLITGGVHGDEYEPMAALRGLIARFRVEPPARGRVSVIPVVNESAFARGDRLGEDGIDLARVCPGRADGLVTERVAHALSALIRAADYYIDLHTGGARLRILPLVGYLLHIEPRVLEAQRRMAKRFGLPIVWGTDPAPDGRTLSVARDAGVPAIYAEYLGGGGCDRTGVRDYRDGCLRVLADLGIVGGAPPNAGGEPLLVEDPTPGAGHLQAHHPAQYAGFFEAESALGRRVRSGDVLGIICDSLGRQREAIRAESAGIVLALRARPRIEVGESAAVILSMKAESLSEKERV